MIISLAGLVVLIVLVSITAIVLKKRPKKINQEEYIDRWREIQSCCRSKKSWPQAVTEADKLLDEVLKKQKFSGKSMGERMVSAQRSFSDNDLLWFAHNLSKKINENSKGRLREADVKDALIGFRTALRDLNVLPTDTLKSKSTENIEATS